LTALVCVAGCAGTTAPPARPPAPRDDPASVEHFLQAAAAEKGAERTPSGLIYREVRPGKGAPAKGARSVALHYTASLRSGEVVVAFRKPADPFLVASDRLLPCLQEGLQRMRVGGESRFVCPPALAYGDAGASPLVLGGAPLVFDLELVAVDAPLPVAGH
jgi:FKBP-type peptidyl-prolyl cis-trans isomerase FkpA